VTDKEREIIQAGKWLFERRLVSGWGGNISRRLAEDRYLITAQHAPLGFLSPRQLVAIDGGGQPLRKERPASSETPLHLAVYRGTSAQAIIHAHPPKVLTFSLSHRSFLPLSFEEKYTLGEVRVVPQETPTVTETEAVVSELRLRPVVILQGHGTVAVGKDLQEAFLLTDLLEEAVGCHFLTSGEEKSEKAVPSEAPVIPSRERSYSLFSADHVAALADSANEDPDFQRQARGTSLTTSLTMQVDEEDACWTFHFLDGRIARWEPGTGGEFVFSGRREWWEAIFQNRLDPFLATQQGKLKLAKGELWKLSHWFKPFQRAFAIWQTIPIQ
jgi:L-fuculose-phosphate aldolase